MHFTVRQQRLVRNNATDLVLAERSFAVICERRRHFSRFARIDAFQLSMSDRESKTHAYSVLDKLDVIQINGLAADM